MRDINRSATLIAIAGLGSFLAASPLPAADKAKNIETKTKIHRLASKQRSPFDAFVYINRIPAAAEVGETPADFAGRIFGRLANQEGRILLKLPPSMDRKAYLGFKTFLGSEGDEKVNNCVSCHAPGGFTDSRTHVVAKGGSKKPTPSLRNLKRSKLEIETIIRGKIAASRQKRTGEAPDIADAYSRINVTEADVANLVAFLSSLDDVTDEEFRELIINAKVFDAASEPGNNR